MFLKDCRIAEIQCGSPLVIYRLQCSKSFLEFKDYDKACSSLYFNYILQCHINNKKRLTISCQPFMERVMGIEPTPTAWKAVVLAVILHPQEQASASAIKSYHKRAPLSRQFFLFLRFLMKNVSPASPGIRTAFSQTGS